MDNLERKLGIFTESAISPDDPDVSSSWRTICQLEAEWVDLPLKHSRIAHISSIENLNANLMELNFCKL